MAPAHGTAEISERPDIVTGHLRIGIPSSVHGALVLTTTLHVAAGRPQMHPHSQSSHALPFQTHLLRNRLYHAVT